eukprot:TRINITY_DN13414_c0_g1_i2.p1 TRINITY_DN13414_c0_g1~~TRINITY_DN13414_c0_g1_i2.p1  ORF type:complete len:481 (-),score=112.32 TRINITY_DN13414_c0_g1_i2:72-1514(-)
MAASVVVAMAQVDDDQSVVVLADLSIILATVELHSGGLQQISVWDKLRSCVPTAALAAAVTPEFILFAQHTPELLLCSLQCAVQGTKPKFATHLLPAPASDVQASADRVLLCFPRAVQLMSIQASLTHVTVSTICVLQTDTPVLWTTVLWSGVLDEVPHTDFAVITEAPLELLPQGAPKGVLLQVARTRHEEEVDCLYELRGKAVMAEERPLELSHVRRVCGEQRSFEMLWDTPNFVVGKESAARPTAFSLSPDCQRVLIGFSDGALMIFDLTHPQSSKKVWPPVAYEQQHTRTHERTPVSSLCWHPSSGLFWVSLASGSVRCFDVFLHQIEVHGSIARDGALTGDVGIMQTLQPMGTTHQGRRATCCTLFDYNPRRPQLSPAPFTRGAPVLGSTPHTLLLAALRTGPIALLKMSGRPSTVRGAGNGASPLEVLRRQLDLGKFSNAASIVEKTQDCEDYTTALTVVTLSLIHISEPTRPY